MQASNLPTEKVDAETAPKSKDTNILQPLQFLIAARRGVKTDPSFSEMNIPEDRYISYNGDSGFKSKRSSAPLWTRFIIWLGYMNTASQIAFVLVVFVQGLNFSKEFSRPDSSTESKSKGYRQDLIWSSYWTVGLIALLYLARVYAKRYMAAKIPPHLDPLSYQYQFKSALDERGWQYREIVGRSLEDMEQIWLKDRSQVERFRVEGLMDSASNCAYDVVVILRTEGKVQMSFRAPVEASWRRMVPVLTLVFHLAVMYFWPPLFPFVFVVQDLGWPEMA